LISCQSPVPCSVPLARRFISDDFDLRAVRRPCQRCQSRRHDRECCTGWLIFGEEKGLQVNQSGQHRPSVFTGTSGSNPCAPAASHTNLIIAIDLHRPRLPRGFIGLALRCFGARCSDQRVRAETKRCSSSLAASTSTVAFVMAVERVVIVASVSPRLSRVCL
jgi:hypothetical protein